MAVGYLSPDVGVAGAPITSDAAVPWRDSRGRGLRFERDAGDTWSLRKRAFDVTLATFLLLSFAPVIALIAVFILVDSPGPVLIKQLRVGKNLRPFWMLKLRSMVVDADLRRDALSHLNQAGGPTFKIRKDPRVTRVGSLLRRSSLDELPQLLNVLRGEMSLVGPRPPFPGEVAQDPYRQQQRLRCMPGITGIWQISGRSNLDYEAMVEMDMRYLRDASVLKDLRIVLRTIPAVISGKGAW